MVKRFLACTYVPTFQLRLAAVGAILLGVTGSAVRCDRLYAIDVEPRTLEETAQEAEAIFVATLTKQQPRYGDESQRFIFTDYTFQVEDPILADGVAKDQDVRLTFRGGTIGEQTQEVAGVPKLTVGERYVLMLRPNWAQIKGIPIVGVQQGLFRVKADPATNSLRVFEAGGAPLVLEDKEGLARATDADPARRADQAVTLEAFARKLRQELPRIKMAPPPKRSQPDPKDPRALRTFSRPDDPEARIRNANPESQPAAAPAAPDSPKPPKEPAIAPAAQAAGDDKDIVVRRVTGPQGDVRRFATSGAADLPIVINQFPASLTPWSPEDQFQMSSWNHYASDVFRVMAEPSGTWAYGNGVFDLAGWPDSDAMERQFGSTWADLDNAWAVCFRRMSGNKIVEADIALNPAQTWTLDDEALYDGSGFRSFRRTMTHELGHAWGLDHQFNFLSVMNYPPNTYRPFPLPFMDDAEGIRQNYASRRVETTDLGIYLFYSAGTQSWRQATFPSSVVAGSALTVTDYHLENVGTRTVDAPAVEWYLTTARNFTAPYHYLGTTTYPKLDPFTYFDPPSAARTLSVPRSVPAGSYYLAAFIRGDESMATNGFQGNNSRSFSRTKINVSP